MSSRYTGGVIFNPPGGWSAQFSGSNYLTVPDNSAWVVNTDYTVEFWCNATSFPGQYNNIFNQRSSGTQYWGVNWDTSLGWCFFWNNGSGETKISRNQNSPLDTWVHFAFVKSGTTGYMFLNGVQAGATFTIGTISDFASLLYIGVWPTISDYFAGYISNLRIVKGTAVYTANFTPPTGALLPITNTQLLTCRYPTIVDGSTNAFTITNTGTVTVNTANPFPTSGLPTPALGNAGNGIYTMSQYAALKTANLWPALDPYYENVTLNLHGNAGAVLPFNTDASTNNFQVTQAGDTKPSNLTPFIENGYWSNLFGSNSGITAPNNSAFKPATNAFTVECWVFSTSTAQQVIYGDTNSATDAGTFDLFINSSGFLASDYWTGSVAITTRTSTLAVPANQWSHVVISRTGTTIYLGVNGVLQSFTGPSTFQSPATTYPTVGRLGAYASGSGFIGYISNFRYVNGTNLYSGSTYTVPTSPLTAIANTSLLTCQSNRFVDNSTNAFALTQNGTVAVNPLQPFTAPTGTSAYGSGYFDGSGDYLTTASSSAFDISTGDWTVQGWYYPTAYSASNNVLVYVGASSGDKIVIATIGTAGNLYYLLNGSVVISSSTAAPLNAWSFFALVRSGSTTTLYLNGVSLGTYGSAPTSSSKSVSIGADAGGAGYQGYMSNVRILKGTADTAIPTSPLTAITNTSLLTVQTNAPSQNNTFLDSSTNNFTITRFGNTTQGTFTPYGSNWSNYFDGTGDYLTAGSSISLSGNFTVEGWVYRTTASGNGNCLLGLGNDYFSTGATLFVDPTTGYLRIYTGQAHLLAGTSAAVPLNTWTHVAFVRSSNTLRAYLNGVQVDSASWSATISGTAYINAELNGNPTATVYAGSAGYISNLRVNTTAVYTAAFTPSTAPLTAISGTSLLTCADNRFIDDSTNAYTITRNGDTSVQRFSPFSPTSAYSTSVIGGSGYFDGSGDYLTLAANNAFAFSGDFCIEFWAYKTANTPGNYDVVFGTGDSGTGNNGYFVELSSTRGFLLAANNAVVLSYAMNPNTAAWNHYAVTRSGSTLRLFVGGVVVASTTYSTSLPSTVAVRVGGTDNTFFGYLSDVRVVKGSAVYTTTYTLPTSPLTAISNTQLLTSFTNAAISDNAMMTDWETLGSAQLNTAYKKYGSGSISMLATGDYCRSTQPSTVGDINGGNFTIEFWVYFTSLAADRALISKYGNSAENAGGLGYVLQWVQSSSVLRLVLGVGGGSDALYTWAWSPVVSTWYHVAVTRSGTSGRAFINGVQIGSTSTLSTSDVASPNATQIGKTHTVAQYLLGYMDDVRVTKGVARYTANFTPPTSQVQDQ